MKTINKMYLIISVCFIGIIIIIIQIIFNEPEQNKETTSNYAFCGVKNSNSPEMKIGNNIFKENCAACHKLNKNFVGPALYNIKEKHQLQHKDFLFDFITKEDSLKGNKYVDSLNENYTTQYNHKFNLSKDEVKQLIKYLD